MRETNLHISLATSHEDIAHCMALRWAVFVEEQGIAEHDELDGTDKGAMHVLAWMDGVPCGAARFHMQDDTVKIGRVCVISAYRGRGIGADLINFVIAEMARHSTIRRAVLGAQIQALEFYRQLGFEAFGSIYDDAGIAHQDMERALP